MISGVAFLVVSTNPKTYQRSEIIKKFHLFFVLTHNQAGFSYFLEYTSPSPDETVYRAPCSNITTPFNDGLLELICNTTAIPYGATSHVVRQQTVGKRGGFMLTNIGIFQSNIYIWFTEGGGENYYYVWWGGGGTKIWVFIYIIESLKQATKPE